MDKFITAFNEAIVVILIVVGLMYIIQCSIAISDNIQQGKIADALMIIATNK